MSALAAPPVGTLTLAAILAERGLLPLAETLPMIQQVLSDVRDLHAAGRLHRAIGPDSVRVEENGTAILLAPEALRELGTADDDLECRPPELQGIVLPALPDEIEAVRQLLSQAGITIDPRRIDVYQLGALLCRMLTGQ